MTEVQEAGARNCKCKNVDEKLDPNDVDEDTRLVRSGVTSPTRVNRMHQRATKSLRHRRVQNAVT